MSRTEPNTGVEVVSNEQYTGMTSDEKNHRYGLDGYPCTHQPPHGINLPKERKFVVTRHFPDEAVLVVMMPTGDKPTSGVRR